ncbi:MAG: glucose-6-phosphate isomerase, partial [Myxococcota bacterium]
MVSLSELWNRTVDLAVHDAELGLSLDPSHLGFAEADFRALDPRLMDALKAMAELEGGAVANPDEDRMVGHYWLRAPDLAPSPDLARAITETKKRVADLVGEVARGGIAPRGGGRFTTVVVVGIGGSSLGPMLVVDALAAADGAAVHFLDNTDPDGVDRLLENVVLSETLTVVISKSGGTKETRNGMLELKAAYEAAGIVFGAHALAITGTESKLDRFAEEHGFLARLPMWDWVGGRTSVTSAVGLVPAGLAGVDIDAFLDGAAQMDRWTREPDPKRNPATVLAAAWFLVGEGRGER